MAVSEAVSALFCGAVLVGSGGFFVRVHGQQPPASDGAAHGASNGQPSGSQAGVATETIAWGPGRDIQAGVGARLWAGDQHAARFIFDIYLRNRGTKTVTVRCPSYAGLSVPTDADYGTEVQSTNIFCTPSLRDARGRRVEVPVKPGDDQSDVTLAPGQSVLVSHWLLRTMGSDQKTARAGRLTQVACVDPGQFRMSCELSVTREGRRTHLRTGEAAFEVTPADTAPEPNKVLERLM